MQSKLTLPFQKLVTAHSRCGLISCFPLHAGMLTALILCWQPTHWEFMSVAVLSYAEDMFILVLHNL